MADNCRYDVKRNEKLGRYLVANAELGCGDLIFTDYPFAVGPKPDTPPLCLSCYCPIESKYCSRCSWPICSAECELSPNHQPECSVFSKAKIKFQPVEDWTVSAPQLDCITPLRLLVAKEQDPDRWSKEVQAMETHTEQRRKRSTWKADQINIVKYLVDHCKLNCRFSKELVEQVCGILEVNAVEIPSRGGFSIRAVYPRLAIAAHSCVPNIVHSIFQPDYRVEVRAAVPLQKGQRLHLSYTHVLSPTILRREHLRESKFFDCDCPRCTDPTELGTHLSTFKCSKCKKGIVLSKNPLDKEASWNCSENDCDFRTSSAVMHKLLSDLQDELDSLDSLDTASEAVEQREAFINKYQLILHQRHSFMLCVKHALVQLYGRIEDRGIEEHVMSKRKVELGKQVLQTLDVITPGESRMRGMLLYDLHTPLMNLARSDFRAGVITKEKLKEKLKVSLQCLTDAARILCREDDQSPEGITGKIAFQSMEQLQASIAIL
ncbi:SET domain-containing protein SmydA-8 [Danaus plexippus]|uniref:SET domain-containing protein SmydA-8 n=1 Tax=Danaus plexippus TaxID=13037 RepID=UPI002AB18691|nr:SET domain-containing protein SmydA-8 [Danaus plexippus]